MKKQTKYLSAAIQMMKEKTKGRDARALHGCHLDESVFNTKTLILEY
jgi:hypothetical protein